MAVKDYTLKNKINLKLTEDQNEIVEFLLKTPWAFNLAQTGFGKTITTVTAAIHKMIAEKQEGNTSHFIVVVPNPAVRAFTKTFTDILGIPYNIITSDTKRPEKGASFTIVTYSALSNGLFSRASKKKITNDALSFILEKYNQVDKLFLIADEAHALQDTKTAQYKTIGMIKTLMRGGWFLTATPILNSIRGLRNMVEVVVPNFFGSEIEFSNNYEILESYDRWVRDRYNKPVKRTFYELKAYKNLKELKEKFSKIAIIKSRIYDVEFIYKSTKLSESMQKYYRWAADGIFSGTVDKGKTKAQRGKKQPEEEKIKDVQDAAGARLHDLQRVVSNSHVRLRAIKNPDKVTEKELLLINTVKEVLEKDQAVLIFCGYRETLARLKYILSKIQDSYGISKILEVHGDISLQQRTAVETAIVERTVVLMTSAGTESMNLQKANNIIFYEIPFSLRQFIQAVGRITRIDSIFSKFKVYILEAEGTIDTYKKYRLIANTEPIKAVLEAGNSLPAELLVLSLVDKQDMKDDLLWKT